MKQEELHELPHKEIVKSELIDLCKFYITVPTVLDTYLSSRLNDLSEYSLRLTAMSSFFQAVQTSTRLARTCECFIFFLLFILLKCFRSLQNYEQMGFKGTVSRDF